MVRIAGALALACMAGVASAQISPGPLTWAHRDLDGTTQCTSCHRLGAGDAAFTCLECHTEVASRLEAGKGLHASYGLTPASAKECARCHSEHNGREFRLIHWDAKKLDHAETGYPLEGKHREAPCQRCHTPAHVAAGDRGTIRIKDLSRTFLGLRPDCKGCHEDRHAGRLGDRCQECHGFADWKSVTVGPVDHARTRYPLLGRHAQVPCAKCHTPGADGRVRYLGIAFDGCAKCHADPHRGSFPGACASCHGPEDWKAVSVRALQDAFDHGRTAYPLQGKHATVPCARCHAGGDFKRAVAHDRCTRCHVPDPHKGQFAGRPGGVECSSCHTVDGFARTTFAANDHASTAYPLQGRHAAVPCAKCHGGPGKEARFKIPFARCTDCHRDAHAAQFAAAPHRNQCESCHTLDGYRPSTFSLFRHASTRFALTGGHLAVPCVDCHKDAAPPVRTTMPFHWDGLSCTSCHADPHRGQFAERMRLVAGDGRGAAGCEACHDSRSWKELSRFDHARTAFPLEGSHRATPCIECHRPPNLEVTMLHADFKAAPEECQECHEDVHGRQFEKGGTTPCAGCHGAASWRRATFDHDRTSFPLDGRHRNVRCEGCHKVTRQVSGKTVLFYKPTPRDCAACHGPAA